MRSAIVHYWVLGRRGGEKVLEALCRLLPDADIFTLFLNEATLSTNCAGTRLRFRFSTRCGGGTGRCCR